MADLPYSCPCGHPTENPVGTPWETSEPDGLCSDREDHAPGAAKCKCHDAQGRLIVKGGK